MVLVGTGWSVIHQLPHHYIPTVDTRQRRPVQQFLYFLIVLLLLLYIAYLFYAKDP